MAKTAVYEVRQKEALDWPLAAAAVVLHMKGNTAESAIVVMGHVAPVPWPSPEAAEALKGKSLSDETADDAGKAAVTKATPLSMNKYKVQLARVAVKRRSECRNEGGCRAICVALVTIRRVVHGERPISRLISRARQDNLLVLPQSHCRRLRCKEMWTRESVPPGAVSSGTMGGTRPRTYLISTAKPATDQPGRACFEVIVPISKCGRTGSSTKVTLIFMPLTILQCCLQSSFSFTLRGLTAHQHL
jgi:hypothetical protein